MTLGVAVARMRGARARIELWREGAGWGSVTCEFLALGHAVAHMKEMQSSGVSPRHVRVLVTFPDVKDLAEWWGEEKEKHGKR